MRNVRSGWLAAVALVLAASAPPAGADEKAMRDALAQAGLK